MGEGIKRRKLVLDMSEEMAKTLEFLAQMDGVSLGEEIRIALERRTQQIYTPEYIAKLAHSILAQGELLEKLAKKYKIEPPYSA